MLNNSWSACKISFQLHQNLVMSGKPSSPLLFTKYQSTPLKLFAAACECIHSEILLVTGTGLDYLSGSEKLPFYFLTEGLWKCRHCDWTHRLSGLCTDHILNHQGYCQIASNVESLVQSGPFYYSPNKG